MEKLTISNLFLEGVLYCSYFHNKQHLHLQVVVWLVTTHVWSPCLCCVVDDLSAKKYRFHLCLFDLSCISGEAGVITQLATDISNIEDLKV